MKVLHFDTENRVARLELTRRNLEVLLRKLDFNRVADGVIDECDRSACEIVSPSSGPGTIMVKAVEDEVHYACSTM